MGTRCSRDLLSRHVAPDASIIAVGSPIVVQKRDTLFADDYRREVKAVAYDVFPDGRTFLMQKRVGESSRQPTLVMNWPELVRRRAGLAR